MSHLLKASVLVCICIALNLTSADLLAMGDLERKELTRLLDEIKHLDSIIFVAKNVNSDHSGARFDYEGIERDLLLIQKGLAEHLNAVHREPRTLPKIDADYRYHGD